MSASQNHEPNPLRRTLIGQSLILVAVALGFILPFIIAGIVVISKEEPAKPVARRRPAEKPSREPELKPWEAYRMLKDGERLYGLYCVACHQAEGHGLVGTAPSIRNPDFLSMASDQFLRHTINVGRPGTAMVSWAHLKRKEVEGIISYLRSLESDRSQMARVSVNPNWKNSGDSVAGKDLYATFCAACHGQNATGYAEGGSGPAIGNQGFLAVASDDFIFQTVKHGRVGTPMRPLMGARGLANLDEKEVSGIIAYLRSEREPVVVASAAAGPDPKAGKMHFSANCAACHQPDGSGLPGIAPSIRNADFLAIANDEFIKQTVHRGRFGTAMVQRPDLSDAVLDDIIAYLRAVPSENSAKVTVDTSKKLATLGDAGAGQQKFSVYCAACHGESGKGYIAGGSGPAIGLAGFLDIASDDYIFQTLKRGRIGTAMRPFLGASGLANLSEKDAYDIIAYLRKQQYAPPSSVATISN